MQSFMIYLGLKVLSIWVLGPTYLVYGYLDPLGMMCVGVVCSHFCILSHMLYTSQQERGRLINLIDVHAVLNVQ